MVRNPPCNAGDAGSIPGPGTEILHAVELSLRALEPVCHIWRAHMMQGRSPGERHGNPLQYSCLENPMDRAAWQATDHGVAKSRA